MAGMILGGGYSYNPMIGTPATQRQQEPQKPLETQYGLYNQGVKQQAEDYSGIMQGFKDLYAKAASMPQMSAASQYTPQAASYAPSQNYTTSLANMKNLADTGGYSAQDIADLRARGISPIRSVYANAQRNIDRQRSLQGGYSPNYTAATAKMTRDLSDQIAGATQNVNAGIAERVAQNRIGLAPQLTSTTAQQSDVANRMASEAANVANQGNMFNLEMPFKVGQYNQGVSDAALRALQGRTSLYGTTPALSSLFGNQALNAAQLQNLINQQGQQGALSAIGYGARY